MNIASLLSAFTSFSIPSVGFNWIDILILIVLIFYSIQGYLLGFLLALIDFISFAFSFALGIFLYGFVAGLLVRFLSIPQGFANAIGFFVVAVLFEILFTFIIKFFISGLPIFHLDEKKSQFLKIGNKILGIIPGFFSGLLLSAFIASLIITLPFSLFLKHSVSNSKIGGVLAANTQGFAKDWQMVFGGAVNDTLSFLTVEPKSNELVSLNFKTDKMLVDSASEKNMFADVNRERTSRGIAALEFSDSLTTVARAHCSDMFKRGYFSHYTPEGLSPFDRMTAADIIFTYAGENLALAPSEDLAMKGLMQSPGHKANILSTSFHRIGVGVMDGGIYGEMFCQEFTD
jgi:uncharacterized protein YkwD/uncharacterized membrane protein required for colicin V production